MTIETATDAPGRLARGLALIGYRGTGKSTVGRLLARRLGRPFADADAALEARLGCTIAGLFATRGEPVFRDEEAATLRELTARPGLILATGGGVILRASNRELLRRFGLVVWLRADPGLIATRIRGAGLSIRPALTAAGTLAEVAEVLAFREPLYRETADLEVATDGRSPEQVADAILAAVAGDRTR
jgi:shikimate kinase